MNPMHAVIGRPPLPPGEAKTLRLEMRVRPAQKAAWKASAEREGLTMQAWVEAQCGYAERVRDLVDAVKDANADASAVHLSLLTPQQERAWMALNEYVFGL
jgi:hypothetical protein